MSYKLLSYQAGRDARAGLLIGDTIYDAAKVTRDAACATVLGALQQWSASHRKFTQIAKSIAAGKSRATGMPLRRTKLLAPVLYPGAIFCAGANYSDHLD